MKSLSSSQPRPDGWKWLSLIPLNRRLILDKWNSVTTKSLPSTRTIITSVEMQSHYFHTSSDNIMVMMIIRAIRTYQKTVAVKAWISRHTFLYYDAVSRLPALETELFFKGHTFYIKIPQILHISRITKEAAVESARRMLLSQNCEL